MTKALLIFAIVVSIVLGIYWLFWLLWCWVIPQVWPTGPAGIVAPGYWLFCGIVLLVSWIGKIVFGSSKD